MYIVQQAPEGIVVGAQVQLSNSLLAKVVKVTDDEVVIDVNPPLAGEHLTFEVELLSLAKGTALSKATFGAGVCPVLLYSKLNKTFSDTFI